MEINIPKPALEKMTHRELDNIGRSQSDIRNLDRLSVALHRLTTDQVYDLRGCLERLKTMGTRGMTTLIADVDRWLDVVENNNSGQQRPRTLRQFSDLLVEYIRNSPGFRIYQQQEDSGEWLGYYVDYIEYEREHRSREGGYFPAKVEMHLLHWLLGEQKRTKIEFKSDAVDRRTVARALADRGIMIETDELRNYYEFTKARYDQVSPEIGKQYTTKGYGDPMDERSWWGRNRRVPMMREGVPAKVVIDVVNESGEHSGNARGGMYRPNFWTARKPASVVSESSDDLPGNRELLEHPDREQPEPSPEIPVHPFVPVYHLSRHQRYKINVMELEEYVYDKTLGEQLVLPQITKNLVDVLVSQGRISFQDIIEGKGAGACILLGGPPGVGKTLTAEVFSEATERPLLSVQAAQLGTSPDTIEKQLISVLQRGSRWNAVVLLDEADVYIRERGANMQQNAIVAAFLRILEHHMATIFLTTNRVDEVDDAISSRCLARIDYQMPTVEDQRQIWGVLNDLNTVGLTDEQLDQIVVDHPNLSGRDIKQILKLAALWAVRQGHGVDPESIAFVKAFLPTRPLETGITLNPVDWATLVG